MRAVLSLIIMFGCLGVAACTATRPPTCGVQSRIVESTIADIARERRGREYCQFRRYEALSDLDGDGIDDFVVLFTIENVEGDGNDHADFMSVFLSGRGWRAMTVRTGRRGEQDPVGVEVRDGKLFLDALVYLPNDATCCPSGRTTLVYDIRSDALVLASEHQPSPESAAAADDVTASPVAVVRAFYTYHFAHDMAFTEKSVSAQAIWLAPELLDLCHAYFQKPVPADEVPDIDGDPFTDSQEYPSAFRVGQPITSGTTAEVPVDLSWSDHQRTLIVRLAVSHGSWRITDITFGEGRSLRGVLSLPLTR